MSDDYEDDYESDESLSDSSSDLNSDEGLDDDFNDDFYDDLDFDEGTEDLDGSDENSLPDEDLSDLDFDEDGEAPAEDVEDGLDEDGLSDLDSDDDEVPAGDQAEDDLGEDDLSDLDFDEDQEAADDQAEDDIGEDDLSDLDFDEDEEVTGDQAKDDLGEEDLANLEQDDEVQDESGNDNEPNEGNEILESPGGEGDLENPKDDSEMKSGAELNESANDEQKYSDPNAARREKLDEMSQFLADNGYERGDWELNHDPEWKRLNEELDNLDKEKVSDDMNDALILEDPDSDAFDRVNNLYDKDSLEWQMNAAVEKDRLERKESDLDSKIAAKEKELADFKGDDYQWAQENGLTSEDLKDIPQMRGMYDEVSRRENELNDLRKQRDMVDSRKTEIEENLDENKFGSIEAPLGQNINDVYDKCTPDQSIVSDRGTGICGCCDVASRINMFGDENVKDSDIVDEFMDSSLCSISDDLAMSGYTSPDERTEILHRHGLENTVDISPSIEDVAEHLKNGDTVSLAVYSGDLVGKDIAPRNWDMPSDHMVTVTGVGYDKNGDPAILFINDSSRFSGSNRTFIPVDKFNQMVQNTPHFLAEYSNRMWLSKSQSSRTGKGIFNRLFRKRGG